MLREHLEALYAGSATFGDFARATDGDFQRLARTLLRRWSVPAGVAQEDVEQELRLAAWEALARWNPSGMPLGRYVTWSAVASAKRWLHGQRGALRRSDRAPSRFFAPLSSFGDGEHAPPEEVEAADQEETIDRAKRVGRVIAGLGAVETEVVLALVDARGDVDAASAEVYDDTRLRLACRLDREEDAVALVRRTARLARRLALARDAAA